MDIYWIKDKKRQGPEPEVVIISMLQRGEIAYNTLAWHKGCAEWIPLEDLPALASYFRGKEKKPSSDEGGKDRDSNGGEDQGVADVKVIMMVTPNPYVRCLARMADLYVYSCLVFTLVLLFSPKPVEFLNSHVNAAIMTYGWIVVESICLRFFGTTLGKWIMGIHVFSMHNVGSWRGTPSSPVPLLEGASRRGGLPIMQAFMRTLQVYAFGLGFMLSWVMVVAGLFSLFLLRRTGTTLWDNYSKTVEIYRGFRPMDLLIMGGVLFAVTMLAASVMAHTPEVMEWSLKMAREIYNLPEIPVK